MNGPQSMMKPMMDKQAAASRLMLRLGAATFIVMALGGCGTDRIVTGSIVPEDYHERHPVVIAERATSLEIFPSSSAMDSASRARLIEFAKNFRATGTGQIEILTPQGTQDEQTARAMVPQIRSALAEGGAHGYVSVGTYPADARVASPVRLSFIGLKGTVVGKCGEWPTDLASAGTLDGWNKRPYWNMGCATQTAFAAQVADPRDLAGPRATAPGDVSIRLRAIGKVREGSDPGTSWTIRNSSIGSVGGGT